MKRLLVALRALPRPVLVIAAAIVVLAGTSVAFVVVHDDSGPTKVAVGKPSTSTTLDLDDEADHSLVPDTTSPSPVVAPIGSVSTPSHLGPPGQPGSTTGGTTPPPLSPTTPTTRISWPGDRTSNNPPPEPVAYPVGPADPVELGHVYVVRESDAVPHRVASDPEILDRPDWSGDGRRIVYARAHDVYEPFTMKPDGSDVSPLPTGGIETPTWSSRGDLAVIEYDGTGHSLRINSANGAVHVVSHEQVGGVSGREWSPDGTKLAIIAGQRLWIAGADGSNPVPVTPAGGKVWRWVTWSPDGTRVAFYEAERVKVVGADGTGLTDLAPANADPSFSWSPDGTQLAVAAPFGASPRFAMGIVSASGGPVRSLGVQGLELSWSPDGNNIVYKAWPFVNSTAHLKMISPDGTNNRVFLAPPDGVNFGLGLHWSPDSTHLALSTGKAGEGGLTEPF